MSEIINVPEIFGKNVFNDKAMQERLPKSVYKKPLKTELSWIRPSQMLSHTR